MFQIMPEWFSKASKKLDECIDSILRENYIDWHFAHDSETINSSKRAILQTLVRIDEQVHNPFNITKEQADELQKDFKKIKEEFPNRKPKKIAWIGKSPGKRKKNG